MTIIDPRVRWIVDPPRFCSKSATSPLAGQELHGWASHTIVAGEVRYQVAT